MLAGFTRRRVQAGDPGHERYAKRAMAADVHRLMAALGHRRYAVVGHDRGALVGASRRRCWRPDEVAEALRSFLG